MPVGYQWRFGGGDLVGFTQSSLVLTNLGLSHVGEYSVVVSNRLGSSTSSVASLSLKTPVQPSFDPGLSIAQAGVEARLTWRGEGELQQSLAPDGPWGFLTSTGESWTVHTTNVATFYRLRNPRLRPVDVVIPSSYKPGGRSWPFLLAAGLVSNRRLAAGPSQTVSDRTPCIRYPRVARARSQEILREAR